MDRLAGRNTSISLIDRLNQQMDIPPVHGPHPLCGIGDGPCLVVRGSLFHQMHHIPRRLGQERPNLCLGQVLQCLQIGLEHIIAVLLRPLARLGHKILVFVRKNAQLRAVRLLIAEIEKAHGSIIQPPEIAGEGDLKIIPIGV